MQRSNAMQNPRRRRRAGRNIRRGSALQPPPFVPTIEVVPHTFRFSNAAGTGGSTINRRNLLNLIQVAVTATSTVRIIEGIRLRMVEMWANPTALGAAPNTLQIEWIGENSPSTVISDTSMGVRPAHVRSSPPASSSNRWWSMSGSLETDQLFSLILPANTIVDVTVDMRLVEQEAPTAGDIPIGATPGTLYGNFLDGNVTAVLSPVGYTVIP